MLKMYNCFYLSNHCLSITIGITNSSKLKLLNTFLKTNVQLDRSNYKNDFPCLNIYILFILLIHNIPKYI